MWEEARKGEEIGQTRPVHMMGSWGREEERFTSQKRHACQRGTLGTWRTGEGAWHSLPHPLDPRGSAETPGLVLHALRPEALQRPRQEGLSLVTQQKTACCLLTARLPRRPREEGLCEANGKGL